MSEELYVYYKLDPADLPAVREALESARPRLPAGVDLRVLERREAQVKEALTWMEVYRAAAAHADLDAAQRIVAQALTPYCKLGRHIERFRLL